MKVYLYNKKIINFDEATETYSIEYDDDISLQLNDDISLQLNDDISLQLNDDESEIKIDNIELLDLLINLLIENTIVNFKLQKLINEMKSTDPLINQKVENYFGMLINSDEYKKIMTNQTNEIFMSYISKMVNNAKQIIEFAKLVKEDFENGFCFALIIKSNNNDKRMFGDKMFGNGSLDILDIISKTSHFKNYYFNCNYMFDDRRDYINTYLARFTMKWKFI